MNYAKWLLLLAVIGFSACEKSPTSFVPIDGNWVPIHQFQESMIFWAICFVDPDHGWVVGASGKIMATTDGGRTWKYQTSGTAENLMAVAFTDRQNGWIVGRNTVLQTKDQGLSWKPVTLDADTTKTYYAVRFIDSQTGWILSNLGKLFTTADGGQTWNVALTWSGSGLINRVNRHLGFLMPMRGEQLFQTRDGGVTWSTQPIDTDLSWQRDLFFIDENHGWVCNDRSASSMANDYPTVFRTRDGGATWERMHTFSEPGLSKIIFLDRYQGWVVGQKIYFTLDGGINWTCQLNSNSTFFTDLQFIESQTGFALDYGGVLYQFLPRN